MLLSFESLIVGAFAFPLPGATLLLCIGLERAVLPESKNMCRRTIGAPQELGRSCHLLGDSRTENRVTNSRPRRRHSSAGERTERVQTEVPPSEGNEARQEGWQEVTVPR